MKLAFCNSYIGQIVVLLYCRRHAVCRQQILVNCRLPTAFRKPSKMACIVLHNIHVHCDTNDILNLDLRKFSSVLPETHFCSVVKILGGNISHIIFINCRNCFDFELFYLIFFQNFTKICEFDLNLK